MWLYLEDRIAFWILFLVFKTTVSRAGATLDHSSPCDEMLSLKRAASNNKVSRASTWDKSSSLMEWDESVLVNRLKYSRETREWKYPNSSAWLKSIWESVIQFSTIGKQFPRQWQSHQLFHRAAQARELITTDGTRTVWGFVHRVS